MACPLTATFIRATTPLKYHKRYKRLVIVRLCAPIWMSTVFYQFITSRLTWRFLTFDNSDQSCLYLFFSDFKTKADPRCSQVRMLTSAFPIALFMSLRLNNEVVKTSIQFDEDRMYVSKIITKNMPNSHSSKTYRCWLFVNPQFDNLRRTDLSIAWHTGGSFPRGSQIFSLLLPGQVVFSFLIKKKNKQTNYSYSYYKTKDCYSRKSNPEAHMFICQAVSPPKKK